MGEVLPQTENCSTNADEDCDGVGTCPNGFLWSDSFGSVGGWQYAMGVAVDGADNIVVAGAMEGTINYGGSPFTSAGLSDAVIVKFDAQGNHLWSKFAGDTDYDSGASIDTNAANDVVMTGYYGGTINFGPAPHTSLGFADMFLVKYDAQGNALFSKSFGGSAYDYPAEVRFAANGDIVVAGFSTGTIDFGGPPLTSSGGADIVVAKLDAAGNHIWSKKFGSTGSQRCQSMAIDASGNIWLTGDFDGALNFGGATLNGAGSDDVYVAKLDASGNHLFSASYGDSASQISWAMNVEATSGDVFVLGGFLGSIDFGGPGSFNAGTGQDDVFLARFATSGSHVWSHATGDSAYQAGLGVDFQSNGASIAVGSFGGTVDFGGGNVSAMGMNDAFVTKSDAGGAHLSTLQYGDSGFQYATDVAIDSADNIVLIGEFDGTIDFGGGAMAAVGTNDMWIAKLAP